MRHRALLLVQYVPRFQGRPNRQGVFAGKEIPQQGGPDPEHRSGNKSQIGIPDRIFFHHPGQELRILGSEVAGAQVLIAHMAGSTGNPHPGVPVERCTDPPEFFRADNAEEPVLFPSAGMLLIATLVMQKDRVWRVWVQSEKQFNEDQLSPDILSDIGSHDEFLRIPLRRPQTGEFIGQRAEQEDARVVERFDLRPQLVNAGLVVVVVVQYGVSIAFHQVAIVLFLAPLQPLLPIRMRISCPNDLYHRGNTSYSLSYHPWISSAFVPAAGT